MPLLCLYIAGQISRKTARCHRGTAPRFSCRCAALAAPYSFCCHNSFCYDRAARAPRPRVSKASRAGDAAAALWPCRVLTAPAPDTVCRPQSIPPLKTWPAARQHPDQARKREADAAVAGHAARSAIRSAGAGLSDRVPAAGLSRDGRDARALAGHHRRCHPRPKKRRPALPQSLPARGPVRAVSPPAPGAWRADVRAWCHSSHR